MITSGHRPATARPFVLASFSPISGVNGLRRLLVWMDGMCSGQTVKCAPLGAHVRVRARCVVVAAAAAAASDRFVHSVGFTRSLAPEKLGCYAEKTSETRSRILRS